jgi:sugar phosphate isomerase/epimerase
MARIAVSELTTFRWSFEEDVAQYRAAGVQAIGVWRPKLADVGEERGAAMLKEEGFTVSSLQWAGGFTGSDGRSYEESLQDARQAIAAAALLRAGCLIVHSGARGVHTHNHARRIFRQALDKLVPLAEERGVVLAVEPMCATCGSDFTFVHCLDEAVALVQHWNSPALRIALDTYHFGHRPELMAQLPELVPLLALVQLGDGRQPPRGEPNRCPLGEGTIPLARIVHTLDAAGYQGFYEIELMGEDIEACDYGELLRRSAHTVRSWLHAPRKAAS